MGGMPGYDTAGAIRQEGATFEQLIRNEIRSVKEQQKTLMQQGRAGYATIAVLVACICINLLALFAVPHYPALFIAASIYLQMFYFITLRIPVGGGKVGFEKDQILKVFSTLYHTGIIRTTDRFTRIFMDVFFINSRALAPGFLCVFAIDFLFVITTIWSGTALEPSAAIILFQVIAILAFYFLLFRFEPGTARFKEEVSDMKGALAGRYPSWLVGVMFVTAALLVLLLIVSTIILLPGVTIQAFMSLAGLEEMTNLFLFIGIIAVSQYFVVRFFHGIASTRMADAFSKNKIQMLECAGREEASAREGDDMAGQAGVSTGRTGPCEIAAGALLEAKIFRLGLRTMGGLFPVYLVDLDFSVLFDKRVMAVITGYFRGAGSAGSTERT